MTNFVENKKRKILELDYVKAIIYVRISETKIV